MTFAVDYGWKTDRIVRAPVRTISPEDGDLLVRNANNSVRSQIADAGIAVTVTLIEVGARCHEDDIATRLDTIVNGILNRFAGVVGCPDPAWSVPAARKRGVVSIRMRGGPYKTEKAKSATITAKQNSIPLRAESNQVAGKHIPTCLMVMNLYLTHYKKAQDRCSPPAPLLCAVGTPVPLTSII